ncbi:hypothetical protein ACFPRL_11550 [Pseudoclavibacter helvolus]
MSGVRASWNFLRRPRRRRSPAHPVPRISCWGSGRASASRRSRSCTSPVVSSTASRLTTCCASPPTRSSSSRWPLRSSHSPGSGRRSRRSRRASSASTPRPPRGTTVAPWRSCSPSRAFSSFGSRSSPLAASDAAARRLDARRPSMSPLRHSATPRRPSASPPPARLFGMGFTLRDGLQAIPKRETHPEIRLLSGDRQRVALADAATGHMRSTRGTCHLWISPGHSLMDPYCGGHGIAGTRPRGCTNACVHDTRRPERRHQCARTLRRRLRAATPRCLHDSSSRVGSRLRPCLLPTNARLACTRRHDRRAPLGPPAHTSLRCRDDSAHRRSVRPQQAARGRHPGEEHPGFELGQNDGVRGLTRNSSTHLGPPRARADGSRARHRRRRACDLLPQLQGHQPAIRPNGLRESLRPRSAARRTRRAASRGRFLGAHRRRDPDAGSPHVDPPRSRIPHGDAHPAPDPRCRFPRTSSRVSRTRRGRIRRTR